MARESHSITTVCSAATFATIGLLSAWGIAVYYPVNDYHRAEVVRMAFLGGPIGGGVFGWLVATLGSRGAWTRRSDKDDV